MRVRGAPNVHVVESAPHAELLREASLVISHGGHGTVVKAAMAGLPQLIIPHGRDRPTMACASPIADAGIMLPRGSDGAAIRCAVEKLLGEPGYAQAAQALAQRIRTGFDPEAVTREVERLAAAGFRGKRAKVA